MISVAKNQQVFSIWIPVLDGESFCVECQLSRFAPRRGHDKHLSASRSIADKCDCTSVWRIMRFTIAGVVSRQAYRSSAFCGNTEDVAVVRVGKSLPVRGQAWLCCQLNDLIGLGERTPNQKKTKCTKLSYRLKKINSNEGAINISTSS